VARGVIAEELGGKKRVYIALPPTSLEQTLTQQRQELTQQEAMVKQTIGKLSMLTAKKEYPVPKLRFVPEDQLEKYLYQECKTWVSSVQTTDPTKTWWGFQDPTLVEHYEKWIDWYWQQNPPDVQLKLYSNEAPIEKKLRGKYQPRQIRTIGLRMNFTATTWVTGEYVTMIFTREHPHYLVEIHDARFAENLRELFMQIWQAQDFNATTIKPPR
jgi:hypothetical protein